MSIFMDDFIRPGEPIGAAHAGRHNSRHEVKEAGRIEPMPAS
jgi:hypothetical protein